MIKAILFDIDGTLLDTSELVYQTYVHALTHHGYPKPEKSDILKLIGRSLIECYSLLAPNNTPEEMIQTHLEFQLKNLNLSKTYPHTLEILKYLKDQKFKIAAVTARKRASLIPNFKLEKIHDFFDVIIAADDVKNHKPHPDPVLKALKDLGITKDEALFVGDSIYDIQSAKAAEVKTVGATYGYGAQALLDEKPDYLINDLTELAELLKQKSLNFI